MFNFSAQTLERLRQANWHHGYGQDTSEYERILRENGYPVFPCVLGFLHFFGGMRLLYPHPLVQNVTLRLDTTVDDALARIFYFNVMNAVEDVGTPLCIIGTCYDGELLMAMSEEGKFYAFDEYMFLLGTSGEDAIEGLCTRRPFERI